MDFLSITDALVERLESSAAVDEIISGVVPRQTAIAQVTSDEALRFFDGQTVAQKAQGLANWHAVVSFMCSAKYLELRKEMPRAKKTAINAVEDLLALNGIRKGIGLAARDASARAHGSIKSTYNSKRKPDFWHPD